MNPRHLLPISAHKSTLYLLSLLCRNFSPAESALKAQVAESEKYFLQFFRATAVCFPCFFVSDKVQEACKKQNQSKSTTSGLTNVFGGTTTK